MSATPTARDDPDSECHWVHAPPELPERLSDAARVAMAALGGDGAAVAFAEAAPIVVVRAGVDDASRARIGVRLRELCRAAVRGGEVVATVAAGAREGAAGPADLGVPLRAPDGAWWGVLAVTSQRSAPWARDEVELLESVAMLATAELRAHRPPRLRAWAAAAELEATRAELRDARRRLQAEHDRLPELAAEAQAFAILEHLADGVIITDADGSVVFFNRAAAELHGVDPSAPPGPSRDAALGLRSADGHAESADGNPLMPAVLEARSVTDAQWRTRRADGRRVVLRGSGHPLGDDGRRIGAVLAIRDVTAEVEAQKTRQLRDRALGAVSDGILIIDARDGGDRITFVNEGFERMTGYARDEVVGRSCGILFGPGTDPASRRALQHALGTREAITVELLQYRRDGMSFWGSLSVAPVHDEAGEVTHLVGVQKDVTSLRVAQQELASAEAHYRRLVKTSPLGIYALDLEGRCFEANLALAAMCGRPTTELLGRPFVELVDPADRDIAAVQFRRMVSGETEDLAGEFRLARPDGERVLVAVTATTIRERDRVVGVHAVVRDITEQRRMEAELRQSQKLDAVGVLAGGVAHDFNNMLTAISGNAQLLAAQLPPDSPMAADVDEISRAAARAAALTRQLLAFSRKQILRPQRMDLSDAVRRMRGMLQRLVGHGVEVRLSLAPSLPPVHADPDQIEQVVLNLAVNARDAMPDGGRLDIATRRTTVTHEAAAASGGEPHTGDFVVLSVSDQGIGMDAQTRSRVFEPFFTTKPQGKGTGLGLSTVHGIISQSGGFVRVRSEPGDGSTFDVYLPLAPEPRHDDDDDHGPRSGAVREP